MAVISAGLIALLAALAIGGTTAAGIGFGNKEDRDKEQKLESSFKNTLIQNLRDEGLYEGDIKDYIDSMSSRALYDIAKDNGLLNSRKLPFSKEKYTSADWSDIVDYFDVMEDVSPGAYPVLKTYEQVAKDTKSDIDRLYDELYDSLEGQLADNQVMYDAQRSQILGNQYQQNIQLMDTYRSEMSKARRNALEAGASAGLRMAENINTTLATQNKQAQVSLETSNQLAQQLLNQRQAAAGLQSEYRQLKANKDYDYNDRLNANWQTQQQLNASKEQEYASKFNTEDNPYANSYIKYQYNTQKYGNSTR